MGNCTSSLDTIPIQGMDGVLDETSKELLMKALSSKKDTEENMRKLMASNMDVNHKLEFEPIGSCYPLHIASKFGNANAVDLLLQGGANANLTDCQGKTALHWAIAEGHFEVAEDILKIKPDVNVFAKDESTPLFLAIEANNADLVEKLLDAGANVSPEKGEHPLVTAVKGNCVNTIMPLLKGNASPVGVNFDFPEGGPTTMFSWAAFNGYEEIAKFLKEKYPEENGAVSEMEKEIKEENEREGGDGAEDANGPADEAPTSSPPPPPPVDEVETVEEKGGEFEEEGGGEEGGGEEEGGGGGEEEEGGGGEEEEGAGEPEFGEDAEPTAEEGGEAEDAKSNSSSEKEGGGDEAVEE